MNIENKLVEGEGEQAKTIYGYSVAEGFSGFKYSPNGSDTEYKLGTDTEISEFLNYLAGLGTSSVSALDFANAIVQEVEEEGSTIKPYNSELIEGNHVITVASPCYYVVIGKATPENGGSPVESLAMLLTMPINGNVTATIKADAPSIDKSIVYGEETTGVKQNTAAIGDTVNYQITSRVPDMTGYKSYTFKVMDTMSAGLSFNEDSVVVKVGNTTVYPAPENDLKASAIVVKRTPLENNSELIEFDFVDFITYQKDEKVTVTYNATINSNAVIGSGGNKNGAYLIYSNDPRFDSTSSSDGEGTGETPGSEVITYVTGIQIQKKDNENKDLGGATFKIEGSNLKQVNVDKGDGSVVTQTISDEAYEVEVGTNGFLKITGLNAGTYKITEVKAPDGYNLLKDPIIVNVEWNDTDKRWDFTVDSDNPSDVSNDASGDILSLDVINYKGVELPSTGGMGTTLFYIVGGLMVAGSVFMMIMKQQNKA